jgi:hypothetical protein
MIDERRMAVSGKKKDDTHEEKDKDFTETSGTDAETEDMARTQESAAGASEVEEQKIEADALEYVEEESVETAQEEAIMAAPLGSNIGATFASAQTGSATATRALFPSGEVADTADFIAQSMTEEGLEAALREADNANPTTMAAKKPPKWVPSVTKDQAVRDINGMVGEGLESIAKKIGAYVVDKLAGGNFLAIIRGNVKKSRLFREILDDERLLIDSKRLYEFTIAEALYRQSLAAQIDVSNLKRWHFVAAYRVKDEEARLLLLSEASDNKWGVRRILREASDLEKKKSKTGSGRDIIRMIGSPVKALEDPEIVAMCSDKNRLLRDLSASEREQIKDLVDQGKPSIQTWGVLLERLDELLTTIDEE